MIRLVSPDTDLTYETAGRAWINACGTRNFPDGEVFTSPDETKTEGHVRFTYPAVYLGREVEDVRLVFHQGREVEAAAGKGQDYLETLLNSDEGARRLGEAAFGLNYDIARFTRNILFDEKLGGTIHLARSLCNVVYAAAFWVSSLLIHREGAASRSSPRIFHST